MLNGNVVAFLRVLLRPTMQKAVMRIMKNTVGRGQQRSGRALGGVVRAVLSKAYRNKILWRTWFRGLSDHCLTYISRGDAGVVSG